MKGMKISIITLFTLALVSFNLQAEEFKFNNKNLNSIGALVCMMGSQNTLEVSPRISIHKSFVNKKKIGPKASDEIVELSGSCNNIVNRDELKIESLGEEFTIEIDRSNKLVGIGKLGIKDIKIEFKHGRVNKLTIKDSLMLTTISRDLSNSTWAKSNQIFSFTGKKMALRFSRKIAATETGGTLNFNTASFFNVWSDQAFGCSLANEKLSAHECEKLINL